MAAYLWGKVYYKDVFAGIIRQEAGGRCAFNYDESYINSEYPSIAYTLPKQVDSLYSEDGLHPFFDNLVAEGWLRDAQARAIAVKKSNRFALLLAFGSDCAGAVSIIDPAPTSKIKINPHENADTIAALAGRVSLSGIQPKIAVVKSGRTYHPAQSGETSTHIAKLLSGTIPDIIHNEWLATLASKILLSPDAVVEMEIASIKGVTEEALLIKRFDRSDTGEKIHFEEFNQLLGKPSEDKYEGYYEDIGAFISNTQGCIKTDVDKLFRRILVCILLGNTDAHFKNFAMLHTPNGLRLTPSYDMLAAALYPQYQTLALGMHQRQNPSIGEITAKHIVNLGRQFGLNDKAIMFAVEEIGAKLERTKDTLSEQDTVSVQLRDKLIHYMEARWNGTCTSIGKVLLGKP